MFIFHSASTVLATEFVIAEAAINRALYRVSAYTSSLRITRTPAHPAYHTSH